MMRAFVFVLVLSAVAGSACDDPTRSLRQPDAPSELSIVAALDPYRGTQYVHVEPVAGFDGSIRAAGVLLHNGTVVASADGESAGLSNCAGVYGLIVYRAGSCLRFAAWPRAGGNYEVRVWAEGYDTAHAATTVLGEFAILDAELDGAPPGTDGLSAEWTPSAGAHRYFAVVRSEDPACSPCATGWLAETDSTRIRARIPREELAEGGAPWRFEVIALDRAFYEFLTTGATGDLFTVPPIENVEDGRGVVGSWARRTVHGDTVDPVPVRGDWTLRGAPDTRDIRFSGLAADPDRPGAFVAAMGRQGTHLTTDGGRSWTPVLDIAPVLAGGLTFGAGGRAVVVADGSLYGSADGGATWPDTLALPTGGRAVAHVSRRDGLLLIASEQEADSPAMVLRAVDIGAAFDAVTLPTDDGGGRLVPATFAEAPTDGTLYLAGRAAVGDAGFLYRSTDRGESWTRIGRELPAPVRDLAVSPVDGTVYAAIRDGSRPGVWASTDRGTTWTAGADTETGAVVTHPTDGNRIWLGRYVDPGGVFESTDGGATVESLALSWTRVADLAVDPSGRWLYAAVDDFGILRRALTPP